MYIYIYCVCNLTMRFVISFHHASSSAAAAEVLFLEFPGACGQLSSTPAAMYRSLAWDPEKPGLWR